MVNVGGRSKGCSTCRRRRVKCDETRPICKHCERLGLDCSGPRDLAFVEATIVQNRGRTSTRTAQATSPNAAHRESPHLVNLASSSLGCTDLEIYIYHTQKHLCLGGAVGVALREIQSLNLPVVTWSRSDQLLSHHAVLSFGVITFGMQQKQANITNQGYALYSMAVKRLNQVLSEPNIYLRDEVILSVTALAFQECLVPSGPETFEHHINGLERLLELRGLTAYHSKNMSQLYRLARALIIFASFRKGKSSPLAKPRWKTTFRLHSSERESLEQDLYDALADCSNFFTACGEPNASSDPVQIESTMSSMITHVHTFRERWRGPDVGCHNEPQSNPSWMMALQAMWDSELPASSVFSDFWQRPMTDLLMLYYLVFVQIFRVLGSLPHESLGTHFDDLVLQDQSQDDIDRATVAGKPISWVAAAARLAGLKAYLCVPYYLGEKSRYRSGSSPHFQWALTTAWEVLGGNASVAGRRIMSTLNAQNDEIAAKTL